MMKAYTSLAALIIGLGGAAGGCGNDGGPPDFIEDPGGPFDEPDAMVDPGTLTIQGTATGLRGPVLLRLATTSRSEQVEVEQDGSFEFPGLFTEGDEFTVATVDRVPCRIAADSGTLSLDTEISLECNLVASLQVSGPSAPAIDLLTEQDNYALSVSILQQSASVTAVAAMPGVSLTVQGAPVASGAPGPTMALPLGPTTIDVVAYHSLSGWTRTFQIEVTRGAPMAQYAYGKASNPDALDFFGVSVALDGDTLVVGADGEDSDASTIGGDPGNSVERESGAVYVFRRTGANWVQEAYIKAPNSGASDRFGVSVALDGDTLVVGAPQEDGGSFGVDGEMQNDSRRDSGAAYVYHRGPDGWALQGYLKASNNGFDDFFGSVVTIDGDTVAVSAPAEDSAASGVDGEQGDSSASNAGAVYVFRRRLSRWVQEAYIKASNPDFFDEFGNSLALHGDVLAVGAVKEDSDATGIDNDPFNDDARDSGAVYIYRRSGVDWSFEAYLKASNSEFGDGFGASVALEGNTLAVGSFAEDSGSVGIDGDQQNNGRSGSGAVYLFEHDGTSWAQTTYIKPSNTDAGDQFGISVALAGELLAVGANGEDSGATGIDGDQFNSVFTSGAVYLFRRDTQGWAQRAYIKASNTGTDDEFGHRIALDESGLVVGAAREDSGTAGINGDESDNSANASGAFYVFH